MRRYVLITLVLLLGAWLLASCSGTRVNGMDDTNSGLNAPIVKPPVGDKEAAAAFTDPTPGDPYNWRWCNIYGQWYKLGGANIALDPPGYDPGYYMHFWLTEEACEDGWGLYEAQVMYWATEPDSKDGVPGKYDYKWVWLENDDPAYPDMPPCEYYLPIGDYEPANDIYFAIHSVVAKGEWVYNEDTYSWEWNETANETGWGANCGGKYGDGSWDWDGDWKKWGGWVSTESEYNLPLFDPAIGKCYAAWHYGPYSYWRVRFAAEDWYPFPGSNDWVGWCTDPATMSPGTNYCVDVYSSYYSPLPGKAASDNWEFISYMINMRNKGIAPFNHDWSTTYWKDRFQDAVWYFKYGTSSFTPTNSDSWTLINNAIANGDNYYPMDGEWYAVILYPQNNGNFQMNIIEVDP